jgi:hypothetical protein
MYNFFKIISAGSPVRILKKKHTPLYIGLFAGGVRMRQGEAGEFRRKLALGKAKGKFLWFTTLYD